MQYAITITTDDPEVLKTELNTSRVGIIPTDQPMTVAVDLKCSGIRSAEVEVIINFQLGRSPGSNVTDLAIKRRKTCLKS